MQPVQASRDSVAVFGEEPAYASELVLWARMETEMFASLVKRHVLSSSAAAGGLRAAAECVQIALGHCSLLEEQGLALSPVLSKLVRPSVEQALEANLTRIEESVAALAAADDWVLTNPGAMLRGSYGVRSSYGAGLGAVASYLKMSSSAHRFNFMVQVCWPAVFLLLPLTWPTSIPIFVGPFWYLSFLCRAWSRSLLLRRGLLPCCPHRHTYGADVSLPHDNVPIVLAV